MQSSLGSSREVKYLLLLARDLDLPADADYQRINTQVIEVKRMLSALVGTVRIEGLTADG